MTTFARATAPDGRWASRTVAGPFEINRLYFPPDYRHEVFSPERGYVVVLLEGAVCKTFAGDSATLARDSVTTLPAGAAHSSDFASSGTQVLVIRSAGDEAAELAPLVSRRRHERVVASTALGRRVANELGAEDVGSTLALEGLVLQLIASAARASSDLPRRRASWLAVVRDILREEAPTPLSLTELAARVGRRPAHVARVFRHEYGLTVAQYARSLRLEWACERLAADEMPITQVAVAAGFVDQSHFTRAFRRHTGMTPGRWREHARRPHAA